MMTLCIRYRFNPDRLADVREYFETEQRVIDRVLIRLTPKPPLVV